MKKYAAGRIFWSLFLVCSLGIPSAALPIGPMSPAEAREKLLVVAGQYEGVPYRYSGMDRRGLDCSALVYLSFQDALSISSPRTAEEIWTWTEEIPVSHLQYGDLVFFNTNRNAQGRASHVGIYAGDGRFIHSASGGQRTGVIYSLLEEPYWRRAFIGAGRVLPPVLEPAPYLSAGLLFAREL